MEIKGGKNFINKHHRNIIYVEIIGNRDLGRE